MKELILQSLSAHKTYVLSRIECAEGAVYYEEMFDSIQRYVQTFENYFVPLFVLEHSFAQLRPSRFSLNRELKYKRLALEHANQVIVGINKRFNGHVES